MVSFAIPEAILLSMHTCVMVCGCSISSYVFCRVMTSLPVTKNPPFSASASEATTNFKILKFTCMGPFKRFRVHFEGMLTKKEIAFSTTFSMLLIPFLGFLSSQPKRNRNYSN